MLDTRLLVQIGRHLLTAAILFDCQNCISGIEERLIFLHYLCEVASGVATPGPARARARATYVSARATELVLEHVANSVSIFLLVFIAKCLFRAVCLPSAAVKIRLLT